MSVLHGSAVSDPGVYPDSAERSDRSPDAGSPDNEWRYADPDKRCVAADR